jgi:ABC-type uncharacterized transport system fused permease/ATPase subunit
VTALVDLSEGLLRTVHSRVRASAEQLAFLNGEGFERNIADAVLAAVVGSSLDQVRTEFPIRLCANIIALCGTVFAYTFSFLEANTGSLGGYPVDAFHLYALANLLISLNLYICAIPDYIANFSEAAGSVHRVGALAERLASEIAAGRLQLRELQASADAAHLTSSTEICSFEAGPVRMRTSGDNVAVQMDGATFSALRGEVVRVSAQTGAGKSTLQRWLAGLQGEDVSEAFHLLRARLLDSEAHGQSYARSNKTNEAQKREDIRVLFAPQRPYLPAACSLLAAVTYPEKAGQSASDMLLQQQLLSVQRCLEDADLWEAALECAARTDVSDTASPSSVLLNRRPWASILSSGQLQRLICARILYHKPNCAILDEPFSMLPSAVAASLLQRLRTQGAAVVLLDHPSAINSC